MLRPEIRRWYGAKHKRLRSDLIALLGPICQKCKREHPRINLVHLTHDVTEHHGRRHGQRATNLGLGTSRKERERAFIMWP